MLNISPVAEILEIFVVAVSGIFFCISWDMIADVVHVRWSIIRFSPGFGTTGRVLTSHRFAVWYY